MCGPGSFLTQEIQPLSVVGRDGSPFLVGFRFSTSIPPRLLTLSSALKKKFGQLSRNIPGSERLLVSSVIPKQMVWWHTCWRVRAEHAPCSWHLAKLRGPSWVTLWLSGKHSSQGCVLKCLCLKALGRAGELRCHAFRRKTLVQQCRSLAASAVQHTKCCASRGQSSCAR